MTRLRWGIAASCPDMASYVRWARLAESCGYDLLGYGDSPCLLPELYVALTAIAGATERTLICPTVTNPLTRHPAVAASAFAALQQVSGGRARFCLGTGDSAALTIGERPASVAELAAYARAFTALTRGDEGSFGGKTFRIEWDRPPVPLWVAAEGPRMLALAGELADGVLVGSGLTEASVRDSLARVARAAEGAGRDPADVEVWFFAKTYICESEEQGWHELAWTLAASAHHVFRYGTEGKFVPSELVGSLQQLQDRYSVGEHDALVRPAVGNAALVRELGLTGFLGRRFLLSGPPAHVRERVEELATWGATNLFTSAMFGDPFAYTSELARHVLTPLSG
jgi:5,10-methylenetetrahydromethanopterin reductase